MENKWNFIRWKDITVAVSNLGNVDLSEFDDLYQLPIVAGDTLSFYGNFDTISSLDKSDWGVSLFDCNMNAVSSDIGLSIDTVSGSFTNFYSQFTVPSLPRYDKYYLIVHDQYLQTAYYISNPLRNISTSEALKTYQIEYNNSSNRDNFFYENVPGFSNKFRIHLNISKPVDKENAEGYQLIDGTFKVARSTSGRTKEFITLWFDEFAHNAFFSMTKHDNIIIDNTSWLRNENDEYTVEWTDNYQFSEGVIRLDDTAYAISNKMC